MVCFMCNVQVPVATMGVEFLAGLTGFVFVCNVQVPVVRIGAGLYAGFTGFVSVCHVQVSMVRYSWEQDFRLLLAHRRREQTVSKF